jgi:hypothetical protein
VLEGAIRNIDLTKQLIAEAKEFNRFGSTNKVKKKIIVTFKKFDEDGTSKFIFKNDSFNCRYLFFSPLFFTTKR